MNNRTKFSLGTLARAAGVAALLTACANAGVLASPVTYRATVVTDVRVGTQRLHNAALTITFVGDTNDVAFVPDATGAPLPSKCNVASPATPYFFWMTKGTASFKVESGGRKIAGDLLPGQIFVSLDSCSGGIGFGSLLGPNGVEPVYPVAFTHGTADAFSVTANPLATLAHTTGNAWSCIGYPVDGTSCTSPDAYPLHTSLGTDLFVYMPYLFTCGNGNGDESICLSKSGSLNRGTFSVIPAR